MNPRIRSLFQKEWIKLRRGVWLLPLILGYAAVDSLLVLRTIDRTHGAFGLWATLISKEPAFFKSYLLLGACGVVLGFLQAWPECQGRRLRLMFHLPVEPQRVLTVLLGTGMAVLLALNLAAHGALAASLAVYHMPLDILGPVLLSLAPWSLLSLAAYLGTVAFFGSRSLPQKGLVLVCCYALGTLLATPAGYGRFAPSLGRYALAALLFVPLVYHAYLRFMGDPLQGRLFRCMRGLSLLAGALALCAVLPGLFGRLAVSERVRQSLHFSPVHGRFVQSSTPPDRGNGPVGAAETRYALEDGQKLTRDQYADALPVLYAEDLMKWKRFPETIAGVRLQPREAKYGWEYHQFMPRDWNAPQSMLHMLLEANPGGARLELPEDVFRVRPGGMGLDFIRPRDGRFDAPKGERFTAALRQAGFSFPVRALGGNPDVRKEYDLGYLLMDNHNALFRLQMVDGAPRIERSGEAVPGRVLSLIVAEHRRREYAGFIVTDQGVLAVLQRGLALRPLPVGPFNPASTRFSLWSDPLGKTLVVQDLLTPARGAAGLALTPDFAVKHTFTQPMHPGDRKALERTRLLASALFPLRVAQTEPGSSYQLLALAPADHLALALVCSLALAVLFFLVQRARKTPVRPEDCLLVACLGPAALGAILLAEWRLSIRPRSLF